MDWLHISLLIIVLTEFAYLIFNNSERYLKDKIASYKEAVDYKNLYIKTINEQYKQLDRKLNGEIAANKILGMKIRDYSNENQKLKNSVNQLEMQSAELKAQCLMAIQEKLKIENLLSAAGIDLEVDFENLPKRELNHQQQHINK